MKRWGLVVVVVLVCGSCGGGSDASSGGVRPRPKAKAAGSGAAGSAVVPPAGEGSESTSLVFVGRVRVEDLEVGKGAPIEEGQALTCEYEIALTGGRVLERSTSGAPRRFTYGAGELLPGWEKGLGASDKDKAGPMRVGGRRKILVPGEWGYGHASWTGPVPAGVGKHETLVITVRLVAAE